ncbi:hypothetical protein F5884DRAFT_756848 [Xylogone sp. PMI_703]|nr:hypothetical protein F5884DRAFT_756848 [Xylogone sp. PMI_703]
MKPSFVLPLLAVPLLEARILSSKDIDSSCGDINTSGDWARILRTQASDEAESMIGIGIQALTVEFNTLPASQQALQQTLLGTGTALQTNRAAALTFLSTVLANAQSSADTTKPPMYIQCGENSVKGIGLSRATDQNGNKIGPRILYNWFARRRVTVSQDIADQEFPSQCSTGCTGYTDGPVIVLCPSFWQSTSTAGSSRKLSTLPLSSLIGTTNFLQVNDNLGRLNDIPGFKLLHELMHWGTFHSATGTYDILDSNGYSWASVAAGSTNSPANTAQLYSYLCYGKVHLF